MSTPTLISLFSGAGGLDLGFQEAGFQTIWANEYDKKIWATHELNFPNHPLDHRSIVDIDAADIPTADGLIGGPPCQSWSIGGAGRGIEDNRGQLFNDYIRVLKAKAPKFFLAENVAGMLQPKHRASFDSFLEAFEEAGYNVFWKLLDTVNYSVPQNRKRVIIVGFRKDVADAFTFPEEHPTLQTLQNALQGLPAAVPDLGAGKPNPPEVLLAPNHEYATGGFSSMFMSRNRVRGWDQPSYTIQASARHAPLHPGAPPMEKIGEDQFQFKKDELEKYVRLSVREAARVQTFPDSFTFLYNNLGDGYKMIGNAVPPQLGCVMGKAIKAVLDNK